MAGKVVSDLKVVFGFHIVQKTEGPESTLLIRDPANMQIHDNKSMTIQFYHNI